METAACCQQPVFHPQRQRKVDNWVLEAACSHKRAEEEENGGGKKQEKEKEQLPSNSAP